MLAQMLFVVGLTVLIGMGVIIYFVYFNQAKGMGVYG